MVIRKDTVFSDKVDEIQFSKMGGRMGKEHGK